MIRDISRYRKRAYLLHKNLKKCKNVKKMVRLTKKNGETVSFAVKGAGRFFKGLVQKGIGWLKRRVKNLIAYLHKGLSKAEDKILKKLDKVGTWANKKIDERFPEEPEPTPELPGITL